MCASTQQTHCQSLLPKAPGSSPAPQVAGRKRRRNRWSDAPPSASGDGGSTTDTAVAGSASAAALDWPAAAAWQQQLLGGTGAPPVGGQQLGADTGGQQMTPLQLQQITEQIEVSGILITIQC